MKTASQRYCGATRTNKAAYSVIRAANPLVEFHEGLPDIEGDFPKPYPHDETAIVVLDDLMREASKSEAVLDILTEDSHHLNFTCFLLLQNLYYIKRNALHVVYFKNCHDIESRECLLRGTFPPKEKAKVLAWLEKIDEIPYSHFVIDYHQLTLHHTGFTPISWALSSACHCYKKRFVSFFSRRRRG